MSWIFRSGDKNKDAGAQQNFSDMVKDMEKIQSSNTKQQESAAPASAGIFNSKSFEAAAEAAKYLEKSKFANQSFELARNRELGTQLELQEKMKQLDVQLGQIQAEAVRMQEEEKRKTHDFETQQQRLRAQYLDQLARKRHEDEAALRRQHEEENARRREASLDRQEAIKKSTIEYEAGLRHQNAMKEIEFRLKQEAHNERTNREIRLEQIRVRGQEYRETVLNSIRTAGSVIGAGFNAFISDWDKVTMTIGAATALAGGIYASKYGIGTAARFVESRISKPSLVRETSRLNLLDLFFHPIKTVKTKWMRPDDPLKEVILNTTLEKRLRDLAIATRLTKSNCGFYRNALMWGPPGTGKTLFAKKLAQASNMEYALMTGGDVTPLGKDGVTAIHKLFNWSNTSKKGLLLFVDEADAFLQKRSKERMSEEMRSTLNAFLQRTGDQSKNFMLVLASNEPGQFDWAIQNRVEEVVDFPLPTLRERERLIRLYLDKYVLSVAENSGMRRRRIGGVWVRLRSAIGGASGAASNGGVGGISVDMESLGDLEERCKRLAETTEGFSGRDIAKLAVAWQARAYASESGVLTGALMDEEVELAKRSWTKKQEWKSEEEKGEQHLWDDDDEADDEAALVQPPKLPQVA